MQAGAKLCEGTGSKGSEGKAAASHQFSKGNAVGSKEVGRFGRKTERANKGLFQCTCREGIKWSLRENRNSKMAAATQCCKAFHGTDPGNKETGSDLGTLERTCDKGLE